MPYTARILLLVALAVAVGGPGPDPVVTATGARLPDTAVAVTPEDVECLALNIYHEARSEPEVGRLAVAAVTLNRVESPRFPSSVCDVVKQGGERRHLCQFSWWCDGKRDDPQESDAWEEALRLSLLSLRGLAEDPTEGALYYHADYVSPRWSRAFKQTAKIGRHHFYRPRPPKPIRVASSE